VGGGGFGGCWVLGFGGFEVCGGDGERDWVEGLWGGAIFSPAERKIGTFNSFKRDSRLWGSGNQGAQKSQKSSAKKKKEGTYLNWKWELHLGNKKEKDGL